VDASEAAPFELTALDEAEVVGRRGVRWRDETSLKWYDEATVWLWLVVSVVFLVILTLQLVGPDAWEPALFWVDWVISLSLLADYLLRIYMAPNKVTFFFHWWNLLDLFVVAVPFVSLFTGAEWAGFFRVARVLRLLMIGTKTGVRLVFSRAQVKWVGLAAIVAMVISWYVVWQSEAGHPDSHIHSAFDALWWSVVTLFTVGYGETYPHTLAGKMSAMLLMIVGIAFFSMFTASLASRFIENEAEIEAKQERARLQTSVDALDERLRHIEELLGGGSTTTTDGVTQDDSAGET
jgi:voltage-gated potassium channel